VNKLQQLNWPELFSQNNLGWYLEELRRQWIVAFDFVLVDSRTGITDIGGICTILLPDILVLMFTTNRQSLDGVIDVFRRARRAQDALSVDRSRLMGIPVPARDESRTEYQQAQEWRDIFAGDLAFIYNDWLPSGLTADHVLQKLRIPYVPFWSFRERLPVVEEGIEDPQSIGYSYALLAGLIGTDLNWEKTLSSSADFKSQDDLSTRVRNPPLARPSVSIPQVFISYHHISPDASWQLL
jgi:hypothetical protein